MPDDKKQPIVVKKIKKGGHGHHGGAWKVAYADFVTAMMAFFLLMWLLGSISAEQRAGISEFFQNPTGVQGPGGASLSMIKLGGAMNVVKGDDHRDPPQVARSPDIHYVVDEQRRLDELLEQLKDVIESSESLKEFKEQLLLDITSEGLRIQIVDKANRPMFGLGSDELKPYTRDILHEIARVINKVPNRITIAGHTDATPYSRSRLDYSNWELSADRANAARRELISGGLDRDKVGRVVGLGSSVLFDKENPFSPINRRISIIVMNRATEEGIGLTARPIENDDAVVQVVPTR